MPAKVDVTIMREYPIFRDMSKEQVSRAADIITVKEYLADKEIWHEGERGRDVFLLLNGSIEITQKLTLFTEDENGTESKHDKSLIQLTAEMRPVVGEIALCANTPRTATVKTITPVKLGFFSANDLSIAFKEDPSFGMLFYRNLSSIIAERLITSNGNVLKLTTAFSLALKRGT